MVRTGLVIVASTRAAQGDYADRSGPLAVEFLRSCGFDTPEALVVADSDMRDTLHHILATNPPSVLLTSGGTGASPDDLTVSAVRPLLDKEFPGITQDFFRRGLENTPLAIASGAVAGISGSTFIMTLPGSAGGVKDGIATLRPLLNHLVDLIHRPIPGQPTAVQQVSPALTIAQPTPTMTSQIPAEPSNLIAARMLDDPIEDHLPSAKYRVMTPAMGALVTFEGIVRDHDGGQSVRSLDYTCHPTAQDVLTRVAQSVAADFPEVNLWTAHRTGHLQIGDMAFAVLAASAHRKEAFRACEVMSNRVKAEVPIWKEQELTDGSSQWVGTE